MRPPGQTNDGADYCACPSGFSCIQVIPSIGGGDSDVSGAYCVESGTAYDPALSSNTQCNAAAASPMDVGYCPVQK